MTTSDQLVRAGSWTSEAASVCGLEIRYARAGSGIPVLVLPRDNGHAPTHEFLDRLAAEFTVYHPWYPGFHAGGDQAAWDWLGDVRDLAAIQLRTLDALGLNRVHLVGLGFGGWV